jgi:hypothetical protein
MKAVPKYALEILQHIGVAAIEEEDPEAYGYTYRAYLPDNNHWIVVLQDKVESFCRWAVRQGADARAIKAVTFTVKEHRKPYYKRDYILFVMTDPVAGSLEKAGLLPGPLNPNRRKRA